ncbi:GNAT family N-acetyltransferase [Clostridium algoriphilum]|uniref:GNAT family N-acetyltransferase n=1 Tax=Clostridium algoriphilum TaxID=198347 RepID=UPI001CF48765|nr:GNAT family N-acetyltransferase [Clostridium algoriphilum]MCB2294509.1 GNAT family N-acetyltransferase [Clostridium algoriphilum]
MELDYKVSVSQNAYIGLKKINEYLYYVEDVLVSYLGISSFGGNNGEINGMTHPDFRRKGLFTKLFELATEECQKRNFNNILLLSDGKSKSGIEFIKVVSGSYDFSEYRMKLLNKTTLENINSINLRKAEKPDRKEIARQNAIFFYGSEECESLPEEEEIINVITYMIELKKAIIGKIKIEYSDNSAFVCGFGILPDFRGKGYGKGALMEVLCIINEENINDVELDVECKNNTALNLYKVCGFEEMSVMNYYRYNNM